MGFTNHYPQFIKWYAQAATPLTQLISGEYAGKKKDPINWNPECKQDLLLLKEPCSQMPVLTYAVYSWPFWLHIDANKIGLGAVFYQDDDDGKRRVVDFVTIPCLILRNDNQPIN